LLSYFSAAGAFFFAGMASCFDFWFLLGALGFRLLPATRRTSLLLLPHHRAGLATFSCGEVAAAQKSKFPWFRSQLASD
jgi:hypothetical protein